MAEKEYISNTMELDERSTEVIRQDIAKNEENISQTVEQIGERIKEKLDWHGYVKNSPYLAIGAAVGIGYLASKMFQARTTPKEQLMRSIAEEVRESLGSMRAVNAGPSLIKMTLLGIATTAAANWINNATSKKAANDDAEPQS